MQRSQSVCAKIRGKKTGRNLAARKMRPQRSMGNAGNVYKLTNKDKATFCSPSEAWVMPAPSSQTEEREFVVDSGASMRMLSKQVSSSVELGTPQRW